MTVKAQNKVNRVFVDTLLDNIQKSAAEWSTKKAEDDITDVLATSEYNTALVIKALRDAAYKAGFINMMFVLSACKTEELPYRLQNGKTTAGG